MNSRIEYDPLHLAVYFPNGKFTTHTLKDLPNKALVIQLAEAHLAMTNTGGGIKSIGTSANYASMLRWIVKTLDEFDYTGGLDGLSLELFIKMMEKIESTPTELRLKKLLLSWDDLNPIKLHPDIVEHCHVQGNWIERKNSDPIPAFTLEEKEQIVKACKDSIAKTEQRIKEGREYAAQLKGKKLSFKDKVILKLYKDGPINYKDICEYFEINVNALAHRLRQEDVTWAEVRNSLYPNSQDAVPYIVLFGLYSGINPDSITDLTLDSFMPLEAGKVRIKWKKDRSLGLEADTFSSKSQWSPGKLAERMIKLNEPLRTFANKDRKKSLWLCYVNPNNIDPDPVRPLISLSIRLALEPFVKAYQIKDVQGNLIKLDRRRLRKTFYAHLDRQYHGAVQTIAGVNQTAQVAANHYLTETVETETITHIIQQTQESFIASARSSQKPSILKETKTADIQELTLKLGIEADKAKNIVTTEDNDVFAAKCSNFYNSPFAEAGEPCPSAVWECLSCPLAIVTPSKLPNIIAVLNRIDKDYEGMTTENWQRKYKDTRKNIVEHIIPQFSEQVVEAARTKALSAKLYISPEDTNK